METTSDNGKTVAIIAYITLIGWIIALVMNNGNKTALGSYHVRQSLGIMCVGSNFKYCYKFRWHFNT